VRAVINHLLRVHAESMHGRHDDQHQQHEQHRIFADALSFIVLDWFTKLQSVFPGRASVPNAFFLQAGADRPELSPRLSAPSLSANSIRGSMAQRGDEEQPESIDLHESFS
jgi:hypothetical protein